MTGTRRERFGRYEAVEGKLSSVDSRAAYVLGPTTSGEIRPVSSHWTYEEAVARARRGGETEANLDRAYEELDETQRD